MGRRASLFGLAIVALTFALPAHAASCGAPATANVVNVPGHPFAAIPSADGCWLFVSLELGRQRSAVAVLRDQGGSFTVDYSYPFAGTAAGMTLAHAGSFLIVADGPQVLVLDTRALEQHTPNPVLARMPVGSDAGAVYVAADPRHPFVFVSDENRGRVSVFQLEADAAGQFQAGRMVGQIPVGTAPVGLALSPDGKWLYSTSESARAVGSRDACSTLGRPHPPGVLVRIDVAVAEAHPARSPTATVVAGCNPVRVAVSPSGNTLWVTDRGSDRLLEIPADVFAAKGARVQVSRFKIGTSPVGVAVRPDDEEVWVTLSNRFGSTKYNPADRELAGLANFRGKLGKPMQLLAGPASGFPRELTFLPDGRTLVATLFAADRVEFVPTPK